MQDIGSKKCCIDNLVLPQDEWYGISAAAIVFCVLHGFGASSSKSKSKSKGKSKSKSKSGERIPALAVFEIGRTLQLLLLLYAMLSLERNGMLTPNWCHDSLVAGNAAHYCLGRVSHRC